MGDTESNVTAGDDAVRVLPGRGFDAGPPYQRRFPSWPLWVMALVAFVDQVDVGVLRGVLPFLQDEWGLNDFQLGTLPTAFIIVGALATIPAGWVTDHYTRKNVIGWTLLSWSGLILLSAGAWNYMSMLGARTVMGIGQAVDDPASSSLLADWYPPRLRARVFSAQQLSVFVGGGLGLALGGAIAGTWHWRWAFIVVSLPSAIVAISCFRLREPRRGEADLPPKFTWDDVHALPPPAPDNSLVAEATFGEFVRLAATQLVAELKVIFKIRTMRYILVGVAALLFTVAGIGVWLPIYHERFSDMSETQATAVVGGLLGVGGLIGTLAGGWLSDKLADRWRGGRIVLVVYGSIICALLFMLSFALQSVPLRLGIQFTGVMAAAGAAPGLRAAMMDVMPAESRGVGASAFALTMTVLGPASAPIVVGALSEWTGSLVTAFYIVFPPVIVGLLFLLRARDTINDDAQAIVVAMYEQQQRLQSEADALGLGHRHDEPATEPES